MALSKIEAKDWLKELGFSDDKVEALAKEFTAAQMTKIAEGYARQSDYDRAMNEGKAAVAQQQEDLNAANQRLNAEMAEWTTVMANGGEATKKMQRDMETAQAAALKAQQVLTRVATEAGLDVTKVLSEVTQIAAPTLQPQPVAPAADLSGYVKASDFQASYAQLANMAVALPAELQQLAIEHQTLFGKPLDTRDIVKEMQTRAGTRGNQKSLDPRAIWEETHKVADARTAAETKRIDGLVAAAEARGREAGMSAAAIPGSAHIPGRPTSPVLHDRKSALERPQPGTTVNSAVSALRSGKYSQRAKQPA